MIKLQNRFEKGGLSFEKKFVRLLDIMEAYEVEHNEAKTEEDKVKVEKQMLYELIRSGYL